MRSGARWIAASRCAAAPGRSSIFSQMPAGEEVAGESVSEAGEAPIKDAQGFVGNR